MGAASWYPDSGRDGRGAVRYACVLDHQPLYTCPPRIRTPSRAAPTAIRPAPGLKVCDARDIGLGDGFHPGPVAITDDKRALPFWLGPDGLAAVNALIEGAVPEFLPERWCTLLLTAGLAVEAGTTHLTESAPSVYRIPTSDSSTVNVCASIRGLIHPFHLGALRLHTRRLLRTGSMHDGDGQTPLRWVQHGETVANWVHQHLMETVSEIADQRLKASYVYTAVYHHGADLAMHTDRQQCRYTVSLCVDCLPDSGGEVPWPLILESPGARVRVYQRLGDGLLFGGQHIPHGRSPMPPGLVVTAMLFHFVDAEFEGPLE